jgi:flagellar FliJ protein
MSRTFHFRLAPLLRVHEATRNECRAALAKAYRAEELLRNRVAELEQSLAELKRECRRSSLPGTIDVDRLIDAQRYEFQVLAQRESLRQHEQTLAAEIERRREALVAADREVRILEKLRQRQREQHQQEQHRHEMKQMDEIAARTHDGERD